MKLELTASFLCFVQPASKFSGQNIAPDNLVVATFDFFKRKRIVGSLSTEESEANAFILLCRTYQDFYISVKENLREKVANGSVKAQPAAFFVHSNNRLL